MQAYQAYKDIKGVMNPFNLVNHWSKKGAQRDPVAVSQMSINGKMGNDFNTEKPAVTRQRVRCQNQLSVSFNMPLATV